MALTNFPQGISSLGFPLIGSGPVMGLGNVWFVNSATGTDAHGYGTDKARPFKTLAYAVSQASAHDVIFIAPGHAETISSSTQLNISVNGLQIIGLGNPNSQYRPTFTLDTATTTTITVSGNGVLIQNCIFDGTGFDAIVKMMNITGAGVALLSCKFIMATSTNQAVNAITVAGDDCTLTDVHIDASAAAGGATAVISGAAVKRLKASGGRWYGDFSTAVLSSASTNHITAMLVDSVVMYNVNAVKNIINLTTSSTGQIQYCTFIGVGWSTAADAIANSTSTALRWAQNYGFDDGAGAVSAVLVPAAGTIA